MPCGAQVLVASADVGEEDTIRGRFGHALSMPSAGGIRQRDPGCAAAAPFFAATTWADTVFTGS
jgi:hypothetical protein